jgi:AAA15 family ATPase/GTPase
MLIEFTVGNFRSFREPVTISLEAASIVSEDKAVDANNLIPLGKNLALLTSAAVYGANASGKSNLISALAFMRGFVLDSARESQAEEPVQVQPFRLDQALKDKPSYFEVTFIIESQKYRYGFEVSRERVEREWLHLTPTTREAELFTRTGALIKSNPRAFREGRGLEERTRPNALFLSVAAQFNGPVALKINRWFRRMEIISGLDDKVYRLFTLSSFVENMEFQKNILNLVRSLDLGIENITFEQVSPEEPAAISPDRSKARTNRYIELFTEHTQYSASGEPVGKVSFKLEEEESEGTQKLFFLSGPVLDTLSRGRILIVDEMEARMHPLITCALIRLFNALETNPKRAQIIFTTHDTNLLDRALFRRDQIWFAEKDSLGASHLYSLVDFKPRNDEVFERNYLRGKYGAVPYLGDLTRILLAEEKQQLEETGDGA